MSVMRAALDVFENEPEVHPGLLKNPNVVSALAGKRKSREADTLDPVAACCTSTRFNGKRDELGSD